MSHPKIYAGTLELIDPRAKRRPARATVGGQLTPTDRRRLTQALSSAVYIESHPLRETQLRRLAARLGVTVT